MTETNITDGVAEVSAEATGRARNRRFRFDTYIALFADQRPQAASAK